MIIGHLPAAYIGTKVLYKRLNNGRVSKRLFTLMGILGGIIPDFDMFYFYFIDNRQNHHHTYWPHFPVVWLTLLLTSYLWFRHSRSGSYSPAAMIFAVNGTVHMLLDTVVGDLWWFMPFIDKSYALFSVPARFQPWWLNFIFHWSFAFEIAIVIFAVFLLRRTVRLRFL